MIATTARMEAAKKLTASEIILMVLLAVAVFVPGMWWQGYVLSTLWGWFVLPVFTAAPAITAWQMAGIRIVAVGLTQSMATRKRDKGPEKTGWEPFLIEVFVMLAWPLLFLGTGWVILQVM